MVWYSFKSPGGGYVNYYELSNTNCVLGLFSNSGSINSICQTYNTAGYNLSGYQKTLCSSGVNLNVGGSVGAAPNNCSSNLRPRLDFYIRKTYNSFPITVGKAFVNNNNSGTPAGANGFVAGNSNVTFDPSIRAGVNSPGLAAITNSWNPTLQSATLSTTADTMSITSGKFALGGTGYAAGTSSTVFNELEIKGNIAGTGSAIVKQRFNTYADTLTMTSGELNLNKKTFTLKNPNSNALQSNGGWIRSEDLATASFQSLFNWIIGTKTGVHSIPFGQSSNNIFPFAYNGTTGDVGELSVATYGTNSSNNTPLPLSPVAVLNMNDVTSNDIASKAVDRFWFVKRSTTSGISNTATFSYPNSEGTSSAGYSSGNMKVLRYSQNSGNWAWENDLSGQSDAINGTVVSVNIPLNDSLNNNNKIIYVVTNKSGCNLAPPVITPNGPTTFCTGGSVTLQQCSQSVLMVNRSNNTKYCCNNSRYFYSYHNKCRWLHCIIKYTCYC